MIEECLSSSTKGLIFNFEGLILFLCHPATPPTLVMRMISFVLYP